MKVLGLPLIDPPGVRRLKAGSLALLALLCSCYVVMVPMPGRSFQGPLPPLTLAQARLAERLSRDLSHLAGDIGERNVFNPRALAAAEEFLTAGLEDAGYRVERQTYTVQGEICANLVAELRGTSRPDEIVVVGGHYDSVEGSPGANDNGTGAVGTLALARAFAGRPQARTLRFVEFVNEEPPFFWTPQQGSWVYARRCRTQGDKIVGMVCLETLGCYRDAPHSQQYPLRPLRLLYPSTGNFVVFVGNVSSRRSVRRCVATFRQRAAFPSEGLASWGMIQGVGWSDHWSFWQEGYPGVMATDTAVFRYPHYHQPTDTPDKVDYPRFARVIEGLEQVVAREAGG